MNFQEVGPGWIISLITDVVKKTEELQSFTYTSMFKPICKIKFSRRSAFAVVKFARHISCNTAYLTFTCSNSTIETLGKGLKYVLS